MDDYITDKLHEECGVFGIYNHGEFESVASATYYGLYALQHRGQESCGIAVNNGGIIHAHRDNGLVNEVFTPEIMRTLGIGKMALGHCRYGTTGTRTRANAQPLLVQHVKGAMALAHNGNLTNAEELREEFELGGGIFHATSDTEVIAYTITHETNIAPRKEEAIAAAMNRPAGA